MKKIRLSRPAFYLLFPSAGGILFALAGGVLGFFTFPHWISLFVLMYGVFFVGTRYVIIDDGHDDDG